MALLLIEGIEPRRHAALPGLLGQHVVGRHALTAADVALVSRTQTYRELADNERTWVADDDLVGGATDEVEPLIARIDGYLRAAGWLEEPPHE